MMIEPFLKFHLCKRTKTSSDTSRLLYARTKIFLVTSHWFRSGKKVVSELRSPLRNRSRNRSRSESSAAWRAPAKATEHHRPHRRVNQRGGVRECERAIIEQLAKRGCAPKQQPPREPQKRRRRGEGLGWAPSPAAGRLATDSSRAVLITESARARLQHAPRASPIPERARRSHLAYVPLAPRRDPSQEPWRGDLPLEAAAATS